MPKFFIGQKVKIKKLVDINNVNDFPTLVDEMQYSCGKKGKIEDIGHQVDKGIFTYNIFGWYWREDWIEPEDFFTEMDFEI